MSSITSKIKNKLNAEGRGWCFTPKHFASLGSSDAIRKTLSRLEDEGIIIRIAHGLYNYPRTHKKLGLLPPSVDSVAGAISEKYHIKIQVSGAYAANLLGLSEQVPAKVVYLTNGESKKVNFGNQTIEFRKTTAKNIKMAGRISGLVVESLRYIKEGNVTPKMINKLKRQLTLEDKKILKEDRNLAPVWIAKIIDKITE